MSGSIRRLVALIAVCLLAVLASMPSALASVPGGTYAGDTSQDRPINIRVNEQDEVTFFKVAIEVSGMFGCVVTWKAGNLDEPIADDGTFILRGEDGLDSVVVKGEFVSRRRAEGTAKTSLIGDCIGDKKVTWSATRS
jgi:hypothetical protein